MKIAINGFGRIGKNFLRVLFHDPQSFEKLDVVAINVGPADAETTAYMFKYDTILGTFEGGVSLKNNFLIINDKKIKILAECDPTRLPWKSMEIDWVIDASGRYTQREQAECHLAAGAKKIVITAPAHDEDISIVPGVNDNAYDSKRHFIISLCSCTTNAIIPMLKIIHNSFEIKRGFMTTAHAYTNSQALLDATAETKHIRRSRAAALNIVPSTTGADALIGKLIPSLKGKIEATAIRVPVPVVSLLDLTFVAEKNITKEKINNAFKNASQSSMKNIVDISYEPLVSSDYEGNPHSLIVDAELTDVIGDMGKVFGWYDNEWGYSTRLKDFLLENA